MHRALMVPPVRRRQSTTRCKRLAKTGWSRARRCGTLQAGPGARLSRPTQRRDELKELLSRYEQNGEGGEEAAGREEVAPVAGEYPGVVVTVQALGAEGEERAPKHRTRPSAASAALPKAKRAKQR